MTFKREDKYLVVKTEDVRKFLHPNDGEKLEEILEVIGSGRKAEGKKDNAYVVVNEDEPYSDIVWKLIEISEEEGLGEEGIKLVQDVVRDRLDGMLKSIRDYKEYSK